MNNKTEFLAEPFLLIGKEGERLVVVVKATFLLKAGSGDLELAEFDEQRPVRAADVPWGDPKISSIKYPSDLCLAKPGTDVIVVSAAHAPGGNAVPSFDAGVRVGPLEKIARVFGLRVWEAEGAGLSAPRPTTGIEMRYDYAWGGFDESDPLHPIEEPRNPVGMGVVRDLATLTHEPAPFIEDPENLIRSVSTRPAPVGLGAIGRHWEPRRKYMGTYDATWVENRAPLLPDDYDNRVNLCASPGLTAVPPLEGKEHVALLNLIPGGGAKSFQLPNAKVRITLKAKGREAETRVPYVDTIVLDTLAAQCPTEVVVEMVWRAAFKPPRRMKDVHIVVAEEEVTS